VPTNEEIVRERIAQAVERQSTVLDLIGLGLTAVPESVRELTWLHELNLGSNTLTTLPAWLSEFEHLTRLQLDRNPLDAEIDAVGEITCLEILDLTQTGLKVVPSCIRALRNLRSLFLGANHLTTLPVWLRELPQLMNLFLHNNELTSIPIFLSQMKGMRILMLPGNPLDEVPTWIGELSDLRTLMIDDLGLDAVPAWVGKLTELDYLSIGGLGVTELPEFLSKLTKLEHLRLQSNRLTRLPEWIGDLDQLRYLWAGGNLLTSLPDEMSRLTQLEHLEISNNDLQSLPDWLLDLPNVQLYALGNPLLSPPPEIVASGQESIMEFLKARRQGSIRQWTSKMLVVGEGGVGKTSTIKALMRQGFNRGEETTHGLRIHRYWTEHPTLPDVSMQLSTWDFGGQQIYHATHQFFLSDRSLFLLLWNSRLGWEQGRLRYWLDIINARAPQSPILLVATNAPADGRPTDLPLDDLMAEYPQIAASLSIDNETAEGLDALRTTIAEQASQLPLMGSDWPASWLKAAIAIRARQSKHISPGAMWRIMSEKAGLSNPEHQEYVANALHHLGDILYYRDVPSLSDIVILRPEWVNEYISKVLDSSEVEQRHGLLSRTHINTLWDDLDRGMRDHFLDMMDRYDLSYRLDGGTQSDVSLVVERLPWNAPPYEEHWSQVSESGAGPEHEIRVIYQLNTTPPGIPTWFIARSHRFTTGTHWRSGALLAHPDRLHRALVRSSPHRHEIELAVRGPAPASFFAVLDDGLTLTLDRYPGLSITRLVPCPCGGDTVTTAGQCEERFDYDDLIRRLNRVPPRHEIECRKSGREVNVALMLLGLAPSEKDELRASIDRLGRTMSGEHRELADRMADMSGDLQRAFLKVQQQVQLGLQTRCPSVFAVVPIRLATVKDSLHELRLYCEEPGAWHPLPDDEGCYQIRESPAWLRRYGPYLHKLTEVLKHLAPLANPVLGMAVGTIAARTRSDIDTMKALVDQLPTSTYGAHRGLDGGSDVSGRADTEADFRELEAMLTQLDPQRRWGGLSRIDTPEGLALYLCADHAAPYLRTARAPGANP
jgi:internalin A